MTDIRVFPGQHVRVLHGDNTCELGVVVSQVSDEVASVRSRSGFLMSVPISSLRRAYLVILDLNGVLGCRIPKRPAGVLRNSDSTDEETSPTVVISDSSYKFSFLHRPHLHTFLKFIFRYFFVAVWTSALKTNAEPLIESIFGPKHNNGINYCDKILFRKFREDTTPNPTPEKPYGTLKDLTSGVFEPFSQGVVDARTGLAARKADFGVNNTIIVDDSPAKCSHPDNSLCPPPFDVVDVADYIQAVLHNNNNNGSGDNGAASAATQQGMLHCMETLQRVLAADSLEPLWAAKCTLQPSLLQQSPLLEHHSPLSLNSTSNSNTAAAAHHLDPSCTVTSAVTEGQVSSVVGNHNNNNNNTTTTISGLFSVEMQPEPTQQQQQPQNQVDYCTNDYYCYDDDDDDYCEEGEAECIIDDQDCGDEHTTTTTTTTSSAPVPPQPTVPSPLTTSLSDDIIATDAATSIEVAASRQPEAATTVAVHSGGTNTTTTATTTNITAVSRVQRSTKRLCGRKEKLDSSYHNNNNKNKNKYYISSNTVSDDKSNNKQNNTDENTDTTQKKTNKNGNRDRKKHLKQTDDNENNNDNNVNNNNNDNKYYKCNTNNGRKKSGSYYKGGGRNRCGYEVESLPPVHKVLRRPVVPPTPLVQ